MTEDTETITPIEDDLQALPATLTSLGFVPEVTALGYRCPKLVGGKPVGWMYFLSAKYILRCATASREFNRDFRTIQAELFEEVFYGTPKPSLYLYIVGTAEELAELDTRGTSYLVELDINYAAKWLGTLDALTREIGGLFSTLPPSRRANAQPSVALLREVRDRPSSALAPEKVFTRGQYPRAEAAQDLLLGQRASDRALVAQVYARVMGRGFKLQWTSSEITFGRDYMAEGVPRYMASSGEQACFDLSCFLVEGARNVTPGLTIGLHGVLTSFDTLIRFRLLDVLQEFVAATGVSLEVQTADSASLQHAKRKLGAVAAVTEWM